MSVQSSLVRGGYIRSVLSHGVSHEVRFVYYAHISHRLLVNSMTFSLAASDSDDAPHAAEVTPVPAARLSNRAKATRAKLTDALVRNARPGRALRIIHDTACMGFALRIYPNGRRTWGFTYRVGKKRGNVVLGPYSEVAGHQPVDQSDRHPLTLAEARALARRYRTKVEAGIDPFSVVAAPLKFYDLALMWLEDYAKPKRKTWEQDRRTLEVDVLKDAAGHHTALARTEVEKIRRGQVMEIVGAVASRGSPRQADKVGILISGIFNWAIEHGKIERDNPAAKLPKYHGNEGRDRYLCDDEIAQLWHSLPAIFPDEPRQIIVKLLLLTGCRKMEIVRARRSELTGLGSVRPTFNLPGDKTVKGKLERGRTKNGAPHTVELSPLAASLFKHAVELSGSVDYVFPSERTNEPFDQRNINKALRWALEGRKRSFELMEGKRMMTMVPTEALLKMPPFVIHDLRRTCATGMARLRIDERIISRCLNHVTPIKASITSKAYVRETFAEDQATAFKVWAAHVGKVVGATETVDVVALKDA